MSEPTTNQFIYKLNAMENAGAQTNAFKAGYKEKRHAVLDHVAELELTLAAQRTALLALFDEAERTGSQGIAVRGREIISPTGESHG